MCRLSYNVMLIFIVCRLLARWESRSPMDGHFSEKINMNNCIQRFFNQIWKSLDTSAPISAEKHLACSSGPPMGTKSGLTKLLDSHFLNPG